LKELFEKYKGGRSLGHSVYTAFDSCRASMSNTEPDSVTHHWSLTNKSR